MSFSPAIFVHLAKHRMLMDVSRLQFTPGYPSVPCYVCVKMMKAIKEARRNVILQWDNLYAETKVSPWRKSTAVKVPFV